MAQCLSVRREKLSRGDQCLLDTSVIALVVFNEQQASSFDIERATAYENFIEWSIRSGVVFLWSPLSFSELTSVVERYHLKRYEQQIGERLDRKRYRSIVEQRKIVTQGVVEAWKYVKRLGIVLGSVIDAESADAALELLTTTSLDGYDALLVRAMSLGNVSYILSDDADFVSAPNIIVYTANKNICE